MAFASPRSGLESAMKVTSHNLFKLQGSLSPGYSPGPRGLLGTTPSTAGGGESLGGASTSAALGAYTPRSPGERDLRDLRGGDWASSLRSPPRPLPLASYSPTAGKAAVAADSDAASPSAKRRVGYAEVMAKLAPPATTPQNLGDDKARLSECRAQLKVARSELSSAEANLRNLTRKTDNETAKLAKEREALSRVVQELDTDAPAVQAELARLLREREKVRLMSEAFRSERAKLEADLAAEERAIEALRGEIADVDA